MSSTQNSDHIDDNSQSPHPPDQQPGASSASSETEDENGARDDTAMLVNDSLGDMMAGNFIQYASYVIKDRAIPDVADGLKPVQRRILHSLHEMDDGRFHKVANVIGHTMRYHPHGDASIGSALVVLANKEYFIDKQGNFGNIYTGDEASAPRYIECRLTELAREVMFNKEITEFADTYDGRHEEPVTLPAKVPALLMLGADGIAVGMSTRILPHNFKELLEAQIACLKGESFDLYPDFFTAGMMDVSEYEDGNGRIKLRAKIDTEDKKTLVIREIPATTTTEGLIASVEDAARRGKLKIASINDFTTDTVEIEIKLPRGVYADDTVKRLYAYTDCEVGLSCSGAIIKDNTPVVWSVTDVLEFSTKKLVDDLRRELEIELGKLNERFHEKTLAQIFIENRIYKRIEECETYEDVVGEVYKGLEPFTDRLRREVTDDDIEKLLQIHIRRISRFDINKNEEELQGILDDIEKTNYDLAHMTDYTIAYVEHLIDKYAKHYPRRTKIDNLETIRARDVALKNVKIGHDRVNHFVGSEVQNSNRNDDYLACTEFDRLVLMQNTGKYKVIQVPQKQYAGPVKYLLKADKNQIYSMIYRHRKSGRYYVKRFRIDSYIMGREYRCIPKGCIIDNLYTNYGVVVRAEFKTKRGKNTFIDIDFDTLELRSKGARGFKLTDREIATFTQLKRGTPTPPHENGGEKRGDTDETDGTQETEAEPENGPAGETAVKTEDTNTEDEEPPRRQPKPKKRHRRLPNRNRTGRKHRHPRVRNRQRKNAVQARRKQKRRAKQKAVERPTQPARRRKKIRIRRRKRRRKTKGRRRRRQKMPARKRPQRTPPLTSSSMRTHRSSSNRLVGGTGRPEVTKPVKLYVACRHLRTVRPQRIPARLTTQQPPSTRPASFPRTTPHACPPAVR